MEIKPQDLGARWHIAIVRHRTLGNARFSLPPHIGQLGRIWASGLELSENVAAATLPMMNDSAAPLVAAGGTGIALTAAVVSFLAGFNPEVVLGSLLIGGSGLFGCLIGVPRRNFRRLHLTPIRWDELEALKGTLPEKKQQPTSEPPRRKSKLLRVMEGLKGAAPRRPGDELEVEFLRFVQDVLDVRGLSPTAESEVRRVVRSIGEAVGSLPDPMLENDDVAGMVNNAERLAEQARGESDSVVAESLLRQAEAHLTRANALDNNRKLVRRTQVLQEELVAQVRAVRSLLPTLGDQSVSAATDFGRLVSVAATVQSIASEASSVAQARQELAMELYPRLAPVNIHRSSTESVKLKQR
jgi:hypothetical protein